MNRLKSPVVVPPLVLEFTPEEAVMLYEIMKKDITLPEMLFGTDSINYLRLQSFMYMAAGIIRDYKHEQGLPKIMEGVKL